MAETDMENQRLTSPEGRNALERYKAVLDLDSANARAQKGLAMIVSRYIELSDSAVTREEFDEADGYLTKAAQISPGDKAISAARRRLEAVAKATTERERIMSLNAEAAERERQAIQEAEAARQADFEKQLAAGQKALSDQDKAVALSAFEAALALYPENEDARAGMEQANALSDAPRHGDTLANALGMTFVYIGPGDFLMGSPNSEAGRDSDEQLHKVTLTQGFWLQTTEVTQGQWKTVMGANPSRFSDCGDNCPVESISWGQAQIFVAKLNQSENDKLLYHLPSEAQWEYAARAGNMSRYCFGEQNANLDGFAWYDRNAGGKAHAVAQKSANAWGLHDMYGNVWEWCQDWYGAYPTNEISDPRGPSSGRSRVLRGGSWFSSVDMCRSAVRYSLAQDNRNFYLGIRLAASGR